METDFEVAGLALLGRDLEAGPARITVEAGEIRQIEEIRSAPGAVDTFQVLKERAIAAAGELEAPKHGLQRASMDPRA